MSGPKHFQNGSTAAKKQVLRALRVSRTLQEDVSFVASRVFECFREESKSEQRIKTVWQVPRRSYLRSTKRVLQCLASYKHKLTPEQHEGL